MKNYAIENLILKHPQRMLISSFKLENGTVITFIWNLDCSATKFTVLVNILFGNVSIVLFSHLMLEEKEMKTLCQ